jgi:flavin-dependent dehydrogenase
LVLGLGPAGSTYVLSRRDASVCAHDLYLAKHGRTRSCCAGGLGFAAVDELRETLPGRVWGVVEGCMYRCVQTHVSSFRYVGEEVSVAIDRHDLGLWTLGLVLDRQCFDMCLANESLRWAVLVREVKPMGRVVYATGFSNPPPVPRRDMEATIQQWVEVREVRDEIIISIIKRYSKVGYFWVFPEVRSGLIKVGVGESLDNLLKRGVSIRQVLEKFKERFGIEGKVVRECGATLPLGKFRRKYVERGGALHIGTAGGFINPLTGAGIKLAILSGHALATGRMDIVSRMEKEINRSYMIKRLLEVLPQRSIDNAISFMRSAIHWFDKEKMFSIRNVALAILALL